MNLDRHAFEDSVRDDKENGRAMTGWTFSVYTGEDKERTMNFFRNRKSDGSASAEPAKIAATDAPKKRRVTKTGLFAGLSAVLVTGSLGAAAYFYTEYKKVTEVRIPAVEVEALVASISEHFELPAGETPTLATVTDREKLSGQDFFAGAQNGDKVLLYQEGRKAILYRPSTGKIVNVAPINVGDPAVEPAPAEVAGTETASEPAPAEEPLDPVIPETPARVSLLNGTTKKGLTADFEKEEVLSDAASYQVVAKENAARSDYETTVVVDLTNDQAARAKVLAEKLGVDVSSGAPDGEAAPPDTDILVILGADRL